MKKAENDIVSQVKPRRDALIVSLAVLIAALISNISIYVIASNSMLREVQKNLRDMASAASLLTDGDLHQQITLPEQKDSTEYKRLQQPYALLLKASPDLRFIYTLILKNDKVFFITDMASGDIDADTNITRKTTAAVMEEYTDTTTPMMEALRDHRIVVEEQAYTDEWGDFISGYAPIYDKNHQAIGIVGVDMDASELNNRMFNVRLSLTLGTLVSIVFSLATGIALFQIRTQHATRSIARQRRLEQSNAFHKHIQTLISELSAHLEKVQTKINDIAEIADNSAEKTREAQSTIHGASGCFESISGAVQRLLQVIQSLAYAVEQTTSAAHGMATQLSNLDADSAAHLQHFIETVEKLSKHSMDVLDEQKEVVGYIDEDIRSVTERTRSVVDMVYAIKEMATVTGQQTFNSRKSIQMLNEQTVLLKNEVDTFLKQINS